MKIIKKNQLKKTYIFMLMKTFIYASKFNLSFIKPLYISIFVKVVNTIFKI